MDGVPKLASLRETFDQAVIFEVVIDIKMRGMINLKLKIFVAHLILTEVLCIRIKTQHQGTNEAQ